jgi:hypothetical protein
MKHVNKTDEIITYFKAQGKTTVASSEVYAYAEGNNLTMSQYKDLFGPRHKIKRGLISLDPITGGITPPSEPFPPMKPLIKTATPVKTAIMDMTMASTATQDKIYVPDVDPCYVPWGYFNELKEVIRSRQFYPVFIAGLSGNGKTVMVEQVCAKLKREYIRVQISKNTDEDDLIGGFRLQNGETVFHKGPVIQAYERGAVLLIDEIDRGTNSLLCLQGIMEGKPIIIKKTGELIAPAPGFTVVATANTKGRGSDDGRYSGALVIDDAFLERFVATIEQEYPTAAVESKIVLNHMDKYSCKDEDFAQLLITWAQSIRKTFLEGGVEEFISTRRLCHIVQTFAIFRDRSKSIELCVSRFDKNTRDSFVELFTKLSPPPAGAVAPATDKVGPVENKENIPF